MRDPYQEPTPYDVLELTPDATAVQIRDKYNAMQRDIQEAGLNVQERGKRKQTLDEAYNQLRVANQRVKVDFFLLDPRIGMRQCEAVAESFAKPNTDVTGLVKPKTIRVTHEVAVAELSQMTSQPGPVAGMHAHAIATDRKDTLPDVLAVEFDC